MKKLLAILLSVAVCVSLAACTGGKSQNNDSNVESQLNTTESTTETTAEPEKEEYEGVPVELAAHNNNNEFVSCLVNFPTDEGIKVKYGRGSDAHDGTTVLYGVQSYDSPINADSIEDVLDEFIYKIEAATEDLRIDHRYSDFKFNFGAAEKKEINGYEMCRYEGTHTYNLTDEDTDETEAVSRYAVAYVARVSNGGYAWWVVFDFSEDYSSKDLVAKNADNMAKTLRED